MICSHTRILYLTGKTGDSRVQTVGSQEHKGALDIPNISKGDYIRMAICLNCGQVQGKFPVDTPEELDDRYCNLEE